MNQWLAISPARACLTFVPPGQFGAPPPGLGQSMSEMVACFDQNGSLLQNENTAQLPSTFLNNTLAKKALEEGTPTPDTVDAGGTVGQVYRYALAIPNPTGSGYAGVALIGESIQPQEPALSFLLTFLLAVGGVPLLGPGLAGLFLPILALAPTPAAGQPPHRIT